MHQMQMFGDDDLGWPWNHELFQSTNKLLLKQFAEYHHQNKSLYQIMEKFALEAGRTRKKFSIWMIANRARWYTSVETTGKEFKVSNDYLALYARLIVILNPQLEEMFTFKKMKIDRQLARD